MIQSLSPYTTPPCNHSSSRTVPLIIIHTQCYLSHHMPVWLRFLLSYSDSRFLELFFCVIATTHVCRGVSHCSLPMYSVFRSLYLFTQNSPFLPSSPPSNTIFLLFLQFPFLFSIVITWAGVYVYLSPTFSLSIQNNQQNCPTYYYCYCHT
jgi:hypothetical protein